MNRIKHFLLSVRPNWALCAVLLAFSATSRAQLPSAQLTSIFPAGAKQGTTADITIAGNDLDEVQSLVFSRDGLSAKPKIKPATSLEPARPIPNEFTVTIAPQTPPGIYEVRAF